MNEKLLAVIGPAMNRTLVIECGCWPSDLDPLYGGDNYEICVGATCVTCGAQFFWRLAEETLRGGGAR